MLDMWATSKGASEAASASNSSSSSIGGPSSTPPISGGDRGSISTPGSIKGLKNISFLFSSVLFWGKADFHKGTRIIST